jgi:hypothetical protein
LAWEDGVEERGGYAEEGTEEEGDDQVPQPSHRSGMVVAVDADHPSMFIPVLKDEAQHGSELLQLL